jgi:hypothetical protein
VVLTISFDEGSDPRVLKIIDLDLGNNDDPTTRT